MIHAVAFKELTWTAKCLVLDLTLNFDYIIIIIIIIIIVIIIRTWSLTCHKQNSF